MTKIICAAVIWLLAASLTFAQNNAAKAAAEAQKAKSAVETIQKECDKGDKGDVAKIKQKLEEARQAAKNAKAFADAAAADNDKKGADAAAKSSADAAAGAADAGKAAGGLTAAEEIAQKIDQKKAELKDKATDDQTLCAGEIATAESLLDAVKKKAQELADKYPCDPDAVRNGVDAYLKELRKDNNCDKLRDWIEKLFPYDVEKKKYTVSCIPHIPDELVITATGLGNTTGDIATVTLFNPTDAPLTAVVGSCFIPSTGTDQSYYVPGTVEVSVPPHSTTNVQMKGWCTVIHLPSVAAGKAMPTHQNWVPVDGTLPAGWTPSPAEGWQPAPGSSALIPGTDQPLGYTIDPLRYPASAAPVIAAALSHIAATYDDMKSQGLITTPFSGNPEKEREAVIQQTFWIYTSELTGDPYKVEDFSHNTVKQYETGTGQKFSAAPPAVQNDVQQGTMTFWTTFQAVGENAKVLKEDQPGTDAQWGNVVEQKYLTYKAYREMGFDHNDAMQKAIPNPDVRREWSTPFRQRYKAETGK